MAEAGLLGQLGRAHRRLDHRLDHHVARVARRGGARVRVHQLGQELLVERAPVDADADRLVVVDGDLDDRREVLVVALRADVARVDPVLRERRRHLRVLDQELVAVVVEVADDRHVDAEAVGACAPSRGRPPRPASVLTVTRTSCEPACASCATWIAVASASAVSVFVIDWTTTGWAEPTSTPPTSTVTVGRRRGLGAGPGLAIAARQVGAAARIRAMSKAVIQIRNANRSTNPTR